jgi:hypothetical protein
MSLSGYTAQANRPDGLLPIIFPICCTHAPIEDSSSSELARGFQTKNLLFVENHADRDGQDNKRQNLRLSKGPNTSILAQ